MKIYKHILNPPVPLGEYLSKIVTPVGQMLWIEGYENPFLVGLINTEGGSLNPEGYGLRDVVVASAFLDINEIEFVTNEGLAAAEANLADLSRLPDHWGGSEKPSELAIRTAQALVRSMEQRGHRVLDVAPIADGGIAVYYAENTREARFDVYNEGGIVVVTRAGRWAPAQYAELPATEAVAALSDFLQ